MLVANYTHTVIFRCSHLASYLQLLYEGVRDRSLIHRARITIYLMFIWSVLLGIAGGHAGYEIAPLIPSIEQVLWTAGHLLLGRKPGPASDLNMVKDHDLHHRFPRSHFSLYFRHWDSWCGTARGAKQI